MKSETLPDEQTTLGFGITLVWSEFDTARTHGDAAMRRRLLDAKLDDVRRRALAEMVYRDLLPADTPIA